MEQTKRRTRVEIRLQPEEKAKLYTVAKKLNTTPSALLRQFINSLGN